MNKRFIKYFIMMLIIGILFIPASCYALPAYTPSEEISEDNVSGFYEFEYPVSGEEAEWVVLDSDFSYTEQGYWPFFIHEAAVFEIKIYFGGEFQSGIEAQWDNQDEEGNRLEGTGSYYFYNSNSEYYLTKSPNDILTKVEYRFVRSLSDVSVTPKGGVLFASLEKMLSAVVRVTGKIAHATVCTALGETVTIDDVIFNEYSQTRLAFFDDTSAKAGDTKGTLVSQIASTVTDWYNLFRKIAIVGYFIILIYMGIKVMIDSTAEGIAKCKQLLVYWVTGIAILFFFPYVIKYAVKFNDGLVAIIEKYKVEQSGDVGNTTLLITANVKPGEDTENDEIASNGAISGEGISYDPDANDYMSVMANYAERTQRLSFAFVYLIMVWQLITIIVLYYKRLFMIAFLIVLFPLVALSYAVDKIGDGKAGAFGTWTQEILTNIFVQSFHAVIYVFAIGVAYSAGIAPNRATGSAGDWLIMLIGVTFLFSGEEILKKIFNQNSKAGTVKSLSETAIKTVAAVTLTKNIGKNVIGNVVGKNSHLKRSIEASRQQKAYEAKLNMMNSGVVDRKPSEADIIPALAHMPSNPNADQINLGKAIETYNSDDATTAEKAKALSTIEKSKNIDGYSEMMKDLHMSDDQMNALAALKEDIAGDIADGVDDVLITQKMKLELEYIFGEDEADQVYDTVVTQMLRDGVSKNRNTNTVEIEEEVNSVDERVEEIKRDTTFKAGVSERSKPTTRVSDRMKELLEDSCVDAMSGTASEKNARAEFAKNVAILEEYKAGTHTSYEMYKSMRYVLDHKEDDDSTQKLTEQFDYDIDEFSHILASEISTEMVDDSMSAVDKKKFENMQKDITNLINSYEIGAITGEEYTVHDALRRVKTGESKEDIANELEKNRRAENQREWLASREFATREATRIDVDLAEKPKELEPEPTLDGMTKAEIEDMIKVAKSKKREERIRTTATVGASILGAFPGATMGAVINGDEPLEGAVTGTLAGMATGDAIAERSIEGKVQKIQVYDKELDKVITVKVPVGGVYSESATSWLSPDRYVPFTAKTREQIIRARVKERREADVAMEKKIKASKEKHRRAIEEREIAEAYERGRRR